MKDDETSDYKGYKCPKCGELQNLHHNLDYSTKGLPIIDILCNECGEFFKPETQVEEQVPDAPKLHRVVLTTRSGDGTSKTKEHFIDDAALERLNTFLFGLKVAKERAKAKIQERTEQTRNELKGIR